MRMINYKSSVRGNMAEKLYLLIYIEALLIIGIQTIVNYQSYGEAKALDLSLSRQTLIILLFVSVVMLVFAYIFYKRTNRKGIVFAHFPKYEFNDSKIHQLIFIFLIIKFIGTFFNVGVVNATGLNTVTTKFSFIFSLITIEQFFPIYYVIARNENKKLYWINVVLFVILRIVQGWSGFILELILFEFYFWEKKNSNRLKNKKVMIVGVLSIFFAIFGGALLYKWVYPLKNYIRYSGTVDKKYFYLSYGDALNKLIERLTTFPMFTVVVQNLKQIGELYAAQNVSFSEFKGLFRPIVPSFILRNKSFRSINNIAVQSLSPQVSATTSSELGLVGYMLALANSDLLEFVLYIVLLMILFIFVTTLLKAFDNVDNDIRIVYFLFVLKVFKVGALEPCFSYGYIGALYIIIILRLMGGIKRVKA